MKKILFTALSAFLLSGSLYSQNYPKDFILPLKIPVSFSANYAELRKNHYHAGLDYRTQQREGLSVVAVHEGYVSRINISPYGYGKALYVTHPNGYTTVYGHLKELVGAIEERARKEQYNKESYSVDFQLKPGELVLKQGDLMALSGNTGGSGGPHLHFEIRDTETEEVLNPFLFGFDIKDTVKPIVSGVWIYPVEGKVNGSANKTAVAAGGVYNVGGEVGFGVKAFDQQSGSANLNGIYSIDTYINNELISTFKADKHSFDETRFLNAGTDYTEQISKKSWIYRTYQLPGNTLQMYENMENRGIVKIEEGETYKVRIEVGDYSGNTTSRSFTMKGVSYEAVTNKTTGKYYVKINDNFKLSEDNLSAKFEKGSFYENFDFNYKKIGDRYQIHNSSVPIHKRFDMSIKPDWSVLDKSKSEHYAIVRQSNYGLARTEYLDTEYKNGEYTAKPREFGVFYLTLDESLPTISSPTLAKTKNVGKRLSFTIRDTGSGIKDYAVYIGGKWVLAEYEYKNNSLFVPDLNKEGVESGSHEVEVVVTDQANNKKTYTNSFEKL